MTELTTADAAALEEAAGLLLGRAEHAAWAGPDAARHAAEDLAERGKHVHLVADGESVCLGGCPGAKAVGA